MTFNVIQHMLSNRRYIGELKYRDVLILDAIPPIVSVELFNDVQEKDRQKQKPLPVERQRMTTCSPPSCSAATVGALMFGRKRHKPDG